METTTYTEKEVQEIIRKTVERVSPFFHTNVKRLLSDEIFEELKTKEKKTFYRVCNQETLRGLWYDYQGNFTGLIHDKEFDFCTHKNLKMEFDEELVGWLSATDTLNKLFEWFPKEEIIKLQEFGWYLHEFEATQYKFYAPFEHLIIEQSTSKVIKKIEF
jgi:hypothetical protein